MEIWLKQGKKQLRLPILPQEVGESGEQDNKTEIVNALGEVNLLGLPKLETVSLEAHFPEKPMYYDQYSGYPSPKKCQEASQGQRLVLKIHHPSNITFLHSFNANVKRDLHLSRHLVQDV